MDQAGAPGGRMAARVDGSPGGPTELRFAAGEAARRGAMPHVITTGPVPGGHPIHARVPGPLCDAVGGRARPVPIRLACEVPRDGPGLPLGRTAARPPLARARTGVSRDTGVVAVACGRRTGVAGTVAPRRAAAGAETTAPHRAAGAGGERP
jgi:hypothetical protein